MAGPDAGKRCDTITGLGLAMNATVTERYYLRLLNDTHDWAPAEEAQAVVIPGFEWLNLFVHRAHGEDGYFVSEAKTGWIAHGKCQRTPAATVEDAVYRITEALCSISNGPDWRIKAERRIARTIRQYGRSPWGRRVSTK